jgi:hypothetical protein
MKSLCDEIRLAPDEIALWAGVVSLSGRIEFETGVSQKRCAR